MNTTIFSTPGSGSKNDWRSHDLRHDRFLGNQDTLYINTPSVSTTARQIFINNYIEGTIDFIFG